MTSNLRPESAFLTGPSKIQVQSVLYGNGFDHVERAVLSLGKAAEIAIREGSAAQIELAYGDSSPTPCLNEHQLARLRSHCPGWLTIRYDFFQGNLGSARGHNRLAESSDADFILVQNPDVVIAPRVIETLLKTFRRAGVGMVEAKQLPIEHPKDYDIQTGRTSWASTACAMTPLSLFRQIGGFDADSFFLYCDDVDYSWSVRLAGFDVIFEPSAVVFHDKHLSDSGGWVATSSERYYSAEAALILAHKWSRPDLVKFILADFGASPEEQIQKAKTHYESRLKAGTLPRPVDAEHKVGQFLAGLYAPHRFRL